MKNETETENADRPALVSLLKPEEYDVYIWLVQAYSINWISETLGLAKRKVKKFASVVYKTLEVNNQRELINHYITPNKYLEKLPLSGEDFAYAMASYTDQCAVKSACA